LCSTHSTEQHRRNLQCLFNRGCWHAAKHIVSS
jgi:hypothetical protein